MLAAPYAVAPPAHWPLVLRGRSDAAFVRIRRRLSEPAIGARIDPYSPKGSSLSGRTRDHVDAVAAEHNSSLCKALGGKRRPSPCRNYSPSAQSHRVQGRSLITVFPAPARLTWRLPPGSGRSFLPDQCHEFGTARNGPRSRLQDRLCVPRLDIRPAKPEDDLVEERCEIRTDQIRHLVAQPSNTGNERCGQQDVIRLQIVRKVRAPYPHAIGYPRRAAGRVPVNLSVTTSTPASQKVCRCRPSPHVSRAAPSFLRGPLTGPGAFQCGVSRFSQISALSPRLFRGGVPSAGSSPG